MRGFSLIELIIAITIMALATGAAHVGLSKYEQSEKKRNVSNAIQSQIAKLDNEIATKQNAAYRLRFENGALGMMSEKGFFRITPIFSLTNYDWKTGSGWISISGAVASTGFSFYHDGKLQDTYVTDTATGVSVSFSGSDSLAGFAGESKLASIFLTSFDTNDTPIQKRLSVTLSGETSVTIENVL